MNKPLRVIFSSCLLSSSGYGHHSRTIYRALKSRPDLFTVDLIALGWGQTSWLWEDTKERREIDEVIKSTIVRHQQGNVKYDVYINCSIPGEWEPKAQWNIGFTAAAETTRCSAKWIEHINKMSKVVTVSTHATDMLRNTAYEYIDKNTGEKKILKTQVPIETVGYPVRNLTPAPIELKLDYDFNYLMVCQWSARKHIERAVRWFIEHNKDNEVGLVLKTNIMGGSQVDKDYTIKRIKQLLNSFPSGDRKCKIHLLHGDLLDEEMASLYTHPQIKAFIGISSESFGLPCFEAASSGLPIIGILWGGPVDYLYCKNDKGKMRSHILKVDYTLVPVPKEAIWPTVIEEGSMWPLPDEKSFKSQMTELEKNYDLHKSRARILQKHLQETCTEQKIYKQYVDAILQTVNGSQSAEEKKPEIMVI